MFLTVSVIKRTLLGSNVPDVVFRCTQNNRCGLMMHRPIGAHSHRPLATVEVFELPRVICRKSPIVIFQHLHCPY